MDRQLSEQITEVKQTLEARINDYNAILDRIKSRNGEFFTGIIKRLDAIDTGATGLASKKKFIAKINRYLAIILFENEEMKIRPEKARLKDIEKLLIYFEMIDSILSKVENKMDDKLGDTLARIEFARADKLDTNTEHNVTTFYDDI